MSKMPYFQFYPLDWLRDTAKLSPAAQGQWIKILCVAWNEPERGIYERTETAACYELGIDPMELKDLLEELAGVATVSFRNSIVRIESRRMIREEKDRNLNAIYQSRHRESVKSKDIVRDKKLEVRSQKSEKVNTNTIRPRENGGTPDFMKPIGNAQPSELSDLMLSPLKPCHGKPKTVRSVADPVRKLLICFKAMQEERDVKDETLNRIYINRFADDAEDLIELFHGDYKLAVACLSDLGGDFRVKGLSWTLSTIIRHAGEWKVKYATPEPSRPA